MNGDAEFPDQPVETPSGHVPLNPVDIEEAVDTLRQQIARGVRIVSNAEAAAKAAIRAGDRAYARAFLAHDGPQTEKRHAAEVDEAVMAARDAQDVAVLAFNHARRVAESLEKSLSAYQTIAKSVSSMYGATSGFGG